MDQPATYQIIVPGVLDALWLDDASMVTVTISADDPGQPTSVITGTMDQAALQGLLRRFYNLGLPLISVVWLEGDPAIIRTFW